MKYTPQEWRKAYVDDGFLIVPDLLDSAFVSRLGAGMDQITGTVRRPPKWVRGRKTARKGMTGTFCPMQ
jgi:hypothetical protein